MNPTHGDFTPLNSNHFEDPKVRFRHHSLMQDYGELHMIDLGSELLGKPGKRNNFLL
ncbi:hypothetical protein AtNW77_Chr5g0143841 [Arabidopsis thaliana]